MRIVSVPGRLMRDPVTRRVVDEDGITINPADLYWARAIADGDVAVADDLPAAAAPSPAPELEPAPEASDAGGKEPTK